MLSIPEYSIPDRESTDAAGDSFGIDPSVTVGTGPFIFSERDRGKELVLAANPDCRSGAPGCEGIVMRFVTDAKAGYPDGFDPEICADEVSS